MQINLYRLLAVLKILLVFEDFMWHRCLINSHQKRIPTQPFFQVANKCFTNSITHTRYIHKHADVVF